MDAIALEPVLMERVWGGHRLAALGKALPPGVPIGESWEVSARQEGESVVRDGPLAGTPLGALWRQRRELFGLRGARSTADAFPLLVKLLDATATLSVQVHPPAARAAELGGEPKSEAWLVLAATPEAVLYVGLRAGATQPAFEAALAAGADVSGFLHRIAVAPGDAIYIPSGRIHAIGAGCLILEVQEASDTTYRVFDWNRPGLDGRPRALHVRESLRSIDFADIEPALAVQAGEQIVATPYFGLRRLDLHGPRRLQHAGECAFVVAVRGDARCGATPLPCGTFALLPPDAPAVEPVGASAALVAIDLP